MKVSNSNFKPLVIPDPAAPSEKSGGTNKYTDTLTASKLKAGLLEHLKADGTGKVHEEQLQFAIVNTMIANKSIKLGDEFSKTFAKISAAGGNIEDNVKLSLQELVSSKSLTQEEADSINGISFSTAQLDSNLDALYDNRGSENDLTVAVAPLEEAILKATEVIESFRKGINDISPRPLSTPSNQINSNISGTDVHDISSSSNNVSSSTNAENVSSSRSGFLWKPVSESNGNLVVLLPPSLTGKVSSVEIHSALPPSDTNKIENGKYSGNHNGGRAHFRFSSPGSTFPDGSYVVAKLNNGTFTTFQIGDSSSRNT